MTRTRESTWARRRDRGESPQLQCDHRYYHTAPKMARIRAISRRKARTMTTPEPHTHDWQIDYSDEHGRHYRCYRRHCAEKLTLPRHSGQPVLTRPVLVPEDEPAAETTPLDAALVTLIRKTLYDALRDYDQTIGFLEAMPDDLALEHAARAILALFGRGA